MSIKFDENTKNNKFHVILMRFDIGNPVYGPPYHIFIVIPEKTEHAPKMPILYLKHVNRYLNLNVDT